MRLMGISEALHLGLLTGQKKRKGEVSGVKLTRWWGHGNPRWRRKSQVHDSRGAGWRQVEVIGGGIFIRHRGWRQSC